MTRDLNDARVSFVSTALSFGLDLNQAKYLWSLVMPP
jgi:hypothetical protein